MIFFCLIQSAPVWATTLKHLILQDLVHKSSVIVVGQIVEHHCFTSDSGKAIWTDYTVQIFNSYYPESLKKEFLILRQRGGTIPSQNITQVALGTVHFEKDEKALFFLREIKEGIYQSIGMFQGVFLFRKNQDHEVVYRQNRGVQIIAYPDTVSKMDRKILEGEVQWNQLIKKVQKYLSSRNPDSH